MVDEGSAIGPRSKRSHYTREDQATASTQGMTSLTFRDIDGGRSTESVEISVSDRRFLRPTLCVTSHARGIPNLYRQRVNHLQDVRGFFSEPKPTSALTERLRYPKTSVRNFDRLNGCFDLDITFDIVPLILRKDNHLRNRFLGNGFNAERFNSNTGFIGGGAKLRIDCRPYPADRINLCRCGNRK